MTDEPIISGLNRDQLSRLREALTAMPEQVGPYKIEQLLGEGGFGSVYLAEQLEPVRRTVAIKLVKPGMDSIAVLRRFEIERQTLATLNHPGIAHVIDAGTTDAGRPYFVMEYVDGAPITRWCDQHRADTRTRIELFRQVCDAIQHAHQKGVIHRDIKPSNVLVTGPLDQPAIKLIDFGVAKALGDTPGATMITQQGFAVGTPEYMSPEQAGLSQDGVDVRTDIYAMGVLLYELLTGRLPFESSELRKVAYDQMCQVIREKDPPRPSTRLHATDRTTLAEIATHRALSPTTLIRLLRNELEWIPLKAIRKRPDDRYRSAAEFADDLNNYLSGQALRAGPESRIYRVRKFVSRHRAPVFAGAVVAVSLVGGILGTTIMADQARKARDLANEQRLLADEQRALAEQRFNDLRFLANEFLTTHYNAIADIAGTSQAVEKLIDTNLRYLQKLEATTDDNPPAGLRNEIVDGYIKLAEIRGVPRGSNLGDFAGALDLLDHAQSLLPDKPTAEADIARLQQVLIRKSDILASQGQVDQGIILLDQAIGLSDVWQDQSKITIAHRRQLFSALLMRASHQDQRGRLSQAVRNAELALEQARLLVQHHPKSTIAKSDLTMATALLGRYLTKDGYPDRAKPLLAESVAGARALVDATPNHAGRRRSLAFALGDLARVHTRLGEHELALQITEQADAELARLYDLDSSDIANLRSLTVSRQRLCDAYFELAMYEQSLNASERFLESARMYLDTTNSAEGFEMHANAIERVGRAQVAMGQLDDAEQSFLQTLAIRRRQAERYPDNTEIAQRLGFGLNKLGELQIGMGKHEQGLAHLREAQSIRQQQYQLHPKRDGNRSRIAESALTIGKALISIDRFDDGWSELERGLELRRAHFADVPDDPDTHAGLMHALIDTGRAIGQRDRDEGILRLTEAHEIWTQLKEHDQLMPHEQTLGDQLLSEIETLRSATP